MQEGLLGRKPNFPVAVDFLDVELADELDAKGGPQVKEEGLGLALFVAFELGRKLGELPQTFFE
jgi:hypothetical protein